jgi:hypothetical protein
MVIWAIFLLLSVMHIYSNIKAARSLQLTSLNPARMEVLLADYLKERVSKVQISLPQILCQESCVNCMAPWIMPLLGGKASPVD